MSSYSAKKASELEVEALSDGFRNTLINTNGFNVNKPDFRELEMGSPVSPLRAQPATNSSSSTSSGPNPHIPTKSRSSHSGELSVDSSHSTAPNFKAGHTRSRSCGSHHLIFSPSGSVNSPAANVVPTGNICSSGRVLKAGIPNRHTEPSG